MAKYFFNDGKYYRNKNNDISTCRLTEEIKNIFFFLFLSHHFMANRLGNNGNSDRLFWGAPKSLHMVTATRKLKDAYFLEEKL